MYANDVANCAETVVRLQWKVNLIGEFCDSREMMVNLNKIEIIVFLNGGPLRDYERWERNGIPIRTTSEQKYMGLIYLPLNFQGPIPNESLQLGKEKLHSALEITNVNLVTSFQT